MLKKTLLGTLIIIVLLMLASTLYVVRLLTRDIGEHFAGTYTPFAMKGSGEDIQIDCARRQAYVSLFDRQGVVKGDPVGPVTFCALI